MNFKGKLAPYLLLLPAFVLICWFKLYPILSTLKQAFVVNGALSLANYQRVFAEKTFWNCLNVTLKFNVVTIPLQIIISFLMALLVSSKVRGTGVFRTIFYIPFAVSITVCVMVWNLMFQFNGGVVNSLLSLFGVPPQGFFNDRKQALWCIVVLASWKGCGYWMMFLMAGIKNIDSSVYEAARIDVALPAYCMEHYAAADAPYHPVCVCGQYFLQYAAVCANAVGYGGRPAQLYQRFNV